MNTSISIVSSSVSGIMVSVDSIKMANCARADWITLKQKILICFDVFLYLEVSCPCSWNSNNNLSWEISRCCWIWLGKVLKILEAIRVWTFSTQSLSRWYSSLRVTIWSQALQGKPLKKLIVSSYHTSSNDSQAAAHLILWLDQCAPTTLKK